jgi:hypothetical protein
MFCLFREKPKGQSTIVGYGNCSNKHYVVFLIWSILSLKGCNLRHSKCRRLSTYNDRSPTAKDSCFLLLLFFLPVSNAFGKKKQ